MPVAKDSRVLFVVAAPGDEVAGAGVWMSRRALPGDNFILHISNGCCSPLSVHEARVRCDEVQAALAMLRIPDGNRWEIGVPSGCAHHHLPAIVEAVEDAIRNCRPSLVITHAYEGGDPDRDSASLATSSACRSMPTRAPRILEFPICHSDCDGTMVAGEFLHEALWPPTDIVLPSPCEVAMKKRVLGTYRSQREKWDGLSEGPEVFRPMPPYDYTRSPHCWPVWYEMSNGRTTMPQWLESARLFLKTRQPAAEVRG